MHILTVTQNSYHLNDTCIPLKLISVINMKKAASIRKLIAGFAIAVQCDI